MSKFKLTEAQVKQYHEDGYVILENFLDKEEIDLLLNIGKKDKELAARAQEVKDAKKASTRLSLGWSLEDDIYSALARCERLVVPVEQLLGSKALFYHYKMTLKEPRVGGAWEWHQDYGYWYYYGFLTPDMISCWLAVDRATKENGCMQVIKKSHLLGRVDHLMQDGQMGADLKRVEMSMKHLKMEKIYCEMEPGSMLIFHCNLFHRSDQNLSDHSRWSLITCYTADFNVSFTPEEPNAKTTPIDVLPNSGIKDVGRKHWERIQEYQMA